MNLVKAMSSTISNTLIRMKFVFRLILFFGILLALQACQPKPDTDSIELETVTLQLKWKHQFQFAGYYAALEQGYYADAGLDVQLMEAPDGDIEPAQVVLNGEADFGIAASDLVLLRASGEPVIALAAIYQHSPLIFLSVAGRDIDNIHDLAGEKVMIEAHAAELLAYLESEGISEEELTRVPHTFDPNALIENQVVAMSAYLTDEPFLLKDSGIDYQIFNPRSSGIDFYGDTLFTTEEQIREHPERVKAFLDASLRGWAYALDHPEEMVDLIYTEYSQRHSRAHLLFEAEQTQRLILPEVVEIGYMNPGRWHRINEIYAEMNMTPADVLLEDFIYNRNPRPDLTWVYLTILSIVIVLGISAFITARFYRLNTALQKEISEREQTEQNLRALETRYRLLVENAPFPIVISRLEDGEILYLNPQAAKKYEISQHHAVGRSALNFYQNPEDRAKLATLLDQQGFVQNFEVQLITAGGNKFWADMAANTITFEGNRAAFFSIIDVTERRNLAVRLEEIAMKDELTSLANRRRFMHKIQEEVSRAKRYRSPLVLFMIDVDNLKEINDTYGHPAGDQVLRQVARMFQDNLRQIDFSGRIGGDEFGIILPNTSLDDAKKLADRLLETLSQNSVEYRGASIHFTLSIGGTVLLGKEDSVDELIRRSDLALYQAKNSGRNQIVSIS